MTYEPIRLAAAAARSEEEGKRNLPSPSPILFNHYPSSPSYPREKILRDVASTRRLSNGLDFVPEAPLGELDTRLGRNTRKAPWAMAPSLNTYQRKPGNPADS